MVLGKVSLKSSKGSVAKILIHMLTRMRRYETFVLLFCSAYRVHDLLLCHARGAKSYFNGANVVFVRTHCRIMFCIDSNHTNLS